jgi:hypothetical protein
MLKLMVPATRAASNHQHPLATPSVIHTFEVVRVYVLAIELAGNFGPAWVPVTAVGNHQMGKLHTLFCTRCIGVVYSLAAAMPLGPAPMTQILILVFMVSMMRKALSKANGSFPNSPAQLRHNAPHAYPPAN